MQIDVETHELKMIVKALDFYATNSNIDFDEYNDDVLSPSRLARDLEGLIIDDEPEDTDDELEDDDDALEGVEPIPPLLEEFATHNPWGDDTENDEVDDNENDDPTPWCNGCGARIKSNCHCGPIADND